MVQGLGVLGSGHVADGGGLAKACHIRRYPCTLRF